MRLVQEANAAAQAADTRLMKKEIARWCQAVEGSLRSVSSKPCLGDGEQVGLMAQEKVMKHCWFVYISGNGGRRTSVTMR